MLSSSLATWMNRTVLASCGPHLEASVHAPASPGWLPGG